MQVFICGGHGEVLETIKPKINFSVSNTLVKINLAIWRNFPKIRIVLDNRPFRQLKKETGESGLFW